MRQGMGWLKIFMPGVDLPRLVQDEILAVMPGSTAVFFIGLLLMNHRPKWVAAIWNLISMNDIFLLE